MDRGDRFDNSKQDGIKVHHAYVFGRQIQEAEQVAVPWILLSSKGKAIEV